AGDDVVSGKGVLNCDMSAGGDDHVAAGPGGSAVSFGANFTADDFVSGGSRLDSVILNGDYSAGVVLPPTTFHDVDDLQLFGSSFSYRLTMDDANLSAGRRLSIDATGLDTGSLFFDGHAETDGSFLIVVGGADTTFIGSADGDDISLGSD